MDEVESDEKLGLTVGQNPNRVAVPHLIEQGIFAHNLYSSCWLTRNEKKLNGSVLTANISIKIATSKQNNSNENPPMKAVFRSGCGTQPVCFVRIVLAGFRRDSSAIT